MLKIYDVPDEHIFKLTQKRVFLHHLKIFKHDTNLEVIQTENA